jgi:CrcB protein
MSAATLIGIGLLGGLGAVSRFILDGLVSARLGRELPSGTLAVNLSGTLALGVLVGAAAPDEATRLVGTGLIGGYTTFSAWVLEAHRLGEDGRRTSALANLVVSLLVGGAAVWTGERLGAAL